MEKDKDEHDNDNYNVHVYARCLLAWRVTTVIRLTLISH